MALFEALAIIDRIGIRRPILDTDASHHSGEHAPAGDDIDHGDLLGQAYRIIRRRQEIAQDQDFGACGDAGQNAAGDIDLDIHA